MAKTALAIKYRPSKFTEVTEQTSVRTILENQLSSKEVAHSYLFCGGAGTGKTTCARIFANEINQGKGTPIEMDAASNSSVDDVREILKQAQTRSLDSEYKVFIIDECHVISSTGWQAFLKMLEEPPAKTIFIFCTTDPQKIPKTILSRVQRFEFRRISKDGIVARLVHILESEGFSYDADAVDYLARIADGGLRDAITLTDKCLSYSTELTLESVLKTLGQNDIGTYYKLAKAFAAKDIETTIAIIEKMHEDGKDLKQAMKMFMEFATDLVKYNLTKTSAFLKIPETAELKEFANKDSTPLLNFLVELNSTIKWETYPKPLIEAMFIRRYTNESH